MHDRAGIWCKRGQNHMTSYGHGMYKMKRNKLKTRHGEKYQINRSNYIILVGERRFNKSEIDVTFFKISYNNMFHFFILKPIYQK